MVTYVGMIGFYLENWMFILKNHVLREKKHTILRLELNQDIRIKPPIRGTYGDICNETSLSIPLNMDSELKGF